MVGEGGGLWDWVRGEERHIGEGWRVEEWRSGGVEEWREVRERVRIRWD